MLWNVESVKICPHVSHLWFVFLSMECGDFGFCPRMANPTHG